MTPIDLDSGLQVLVAGEAPQPCKVTVEGRDETLSPRWSRDRGRWIGQDSFAVDNAVLSSRCDGVFVPLTPGDYLVTVSRGIEWELARRRIEVGGGVTDLGVSLEPVANAAQWSCVDLHVHAAPSFDSVVPMDQRLVSAVAEGLDGFVASDHDAIGNWDLALETTGLAEDIAVITGNELTPDQWSPPTRICQVAAFPVPDDFDPRSTMIPGATMEELVGRVGVSAPDALLQINHPRWNASIGWFEAMMWDPTTLSRETDPIGMFDTLEVWNGHELVARPPGSTRDAVLVDWFTLLNAGIPLVATGNSDSHGLAFDTIGYPRTCLPLPGDRELRESDVLEALRSGTPFFTSGPLLDVTVEGAGPGEVTEADSSVIVEVEVTAAEHVDVDFAEIIVNGARAERLPLPDDEVATVVTELALSRDSWIVVGVEGNQAIGRVAGPREPPLRSAAFANPVYVDLDGDGMWTAPGGS